MAATAGRPKASHAPMITTTASSTHKEIVAGSKNITMLPTTALIASDTNRTERRESRSAQTPPTGANKTPERTRAPMINPSAVALPPASRIVTARAIGKALVATIVKIVDSKRFL